MIDGDDVRPRTGVLSGDKLSVTVPEPVVEHPDDSFVTVSQQGSEDDVVTVTLETGRTRLRVRDVDVVFDGFRYFPRKPENYDYPVRGDVGDAKIDFEPDRGEVFPDTIPDTHAVRDLSLAKLITGLSTGWIEPLPFDR